MTSFLSGVRGVAALLSVIALGAALPVYGHGAEPLESAPRSAAPNAPTVTVHGELKQVVVVDTLLGVTVSYRWLKLADGSSLSLKGTGIDALPEGGEVEVTGSLNGKTIFAQSTRLLAAATSSRVAAKVREVTEVEGILQFIHVDYLEDAKSRFEFEVTDTAGHATPIDVGIRPEALQRGMRVRVKGRARVDGTVEPDTISITAMPERPPRSSVTKKAVVTNNVLVILIRFADSGAQPFTQAQVQATFAGGPGTASVAEYFREASYGQQLLNATVTPWLSSTSSIPANCDWRAMGVLARSAATSAGYSLPAYRNLVYVFPRVSACGWSGLAYVGASGVWSNGHNSLLVYGHELGHNFGLLHAGSLDCGAAAIGSPCTAGEYSDPFGMMGNQRAMHFSAPQKATLGWITPAMVSTHTSGSAIYELRPLASPGGTTYAVRVPASANRTYWLEYRQPTGFDAALANFPNNGAQIRIATPLETLCGGCDAYSSDTQMLDMTPATSTFTDATLLVGGSYTDPDYGITLNILSASASALTVQVVKSGPQATTTTLVSSRNPAPAGASVVFTATVTGTSPTGGVSFTAGAAAIAGCNAVPLAGSGNSRTATCTTSSLTNGQHSIVARYAGNAGNSASSSTALVQSVTAAVASPTNVALASSGAIANASSTHSAAFAAASVNNNERAGVNWGGGTGGWNDATHGTFPDWVQVYFNGAKTIDRIVVYTLQDNLAAPVEPTDTMTFTQYGLRDFSVHAWTGSSWTMIANVSGNDRVKRTFTFAPVTTNLIRVHVNHASGGYSRVTEIEAWGVPANASSESNVASASTGAVASASSTHSAAYAVASVINDERAGANWAGGSGGWNDATDGAFPDWVQVNFNGPKTIDRIVVYTLQDNFASPVEPTDAMTFTQYGLRDFSIHAWNGSSWTMLATVSGNNRVKRTFTFPAFTTDRIRVHVTHASYGYSRVTEIEAWGVPASASSESNVASAATGAVASASSTHGAAYAVASVNNNERAGANWAGGTGGWNDATDGSFPDWVQVNFSGARSVNRVVVYTLQDNFASPVEPTDAMTFTQYGIRDFTVQGWNGSTWTTLATVVGNNLVKRTLAFPAFTTDRIRVHVTNALYGYSRVTEIEAWGQ